MSVFNLPDISILLPAYKSEHLLSKVFLRGLYNSSSHIELIIYDNGGNGFTKELREDVCAYYGEKSPMGSLILNGTHVHHPIKIIGDGENIGLNAALNECAKVATGRHFFLPHTDMYLLSGWDGALRSAASLLPPSSYLFCCRSIEPGFSHIPSQIIEDHGNDVDNFDETGLLKEYNKFRSKHIVVNARMPFFMHRNLWEKMGGVDPHYFSYCTDDDLIQTAYNIGCRKFYMIYDSLVYHLQGKSNAQQSVDRDRNEPYEYFVNKWRSKYPDVSHPGQYHPKLLPFEMRIK